jgi:hypothetical protein
MLRAELEFVRKLAADIRAGSFQGTTTWRRLHELRAAGTPMEDILADPVRFLGEEGRVLSHDLPGDPAGAKENN